MHDLKEIKNTSLINFLKSIISLKQQGV